MNDQSQQQPQKLPDIILSSEHIEQLFTHLNNSVLFAKSPDGSMRPFIDPNPIKQILSALIQMKMQSMQPQPGQAPAEPSLVASQKPKVRIAEIPNGDR